jgi:hypothetical protein
MLVRSALRWDITQRRVVIVYRRLGTAYRSHLQGSRSPRIKGLRDNWKIGGLRRPLKVGPMRCPETSVKDYHSTLRNIPEERRCSTDMACPDVWGCFSVSRNVWHDHVNRTYFLFGDWVPWLVLSGGFIKKCHVFVNTNYSAISAQH